MIFSSILNLGFLYFLLGWIIRIAMFVIVPYRRSASAAYAWLMLILVFPVGGLILYLLIGSPKLSSKRRLQQKIFDQSIGDDIKYLHSQSSFSSILSPVLSQRYTAVAILNEKLGGLPVCGGNNFELLPHYYAAIDRIVSDIDLAEKYIHVEYYIFSIDETGTKVIEALGRAVKRGVCCRVLIDHIGTLFEIKEVLKRLRDLGVEAHRMLPVDIFDNEWSRIDLRNHRKIVVIDGHVGYTGSQNLINDTYTKHRHVSYRGLKYEELVVRIQGPVVLELLSVFMADWYSETGVSYSEAAYPEVSLKPILSGDVIAQVLPSGPGQDTENNKLLFISLMNQAMKKMVIVTPYFVPDQSLLDSLSIAAHRGVDVRLIVSGIGDQFIVTHAQRSYYDELLEAGVHIHLFNEPILLHAKTVSIDDDIAVIGSSNMDMRSFYLDLEVSILFYDQKVVSQLRLIEDDYFVRSRELDILTWEKRPFLTKIIENTTRMMSDVI